MNHSRWNLKPAVPDGHPLNTAGLSHLLAQLLYNRSLTDPSQLELFITADKRLSGDPFLMPDMHQAVARIYRAMLSGEKIAVYGDFDADGITATALLVQGLNILNNTAIPYIPHRLTEGHGLKTAALEKLYQEGITLVITVDCGITGVSEVKKAKRKGLDIVITDHHTPLAEIPPAVAVVNPRLAGSKYPFSELAGVGVALKLLQALFRSLGRDQEPDELLDLVALGTVADIMPLLGENRYLVKQGLRLINSTSRPGLREMLALAGLSPGNLDTESITWTIAPRLNAAGRLEHAITSYRLLMTDSPQEAYELAAWLETNNTERQRLTTRVFSMAREQILAQGISPLLIARDKDYPSGIAGLVAGRLCEEFYRPAIVVREGEKISSGSCRSIPEFDIIQALNQFSSLFTQFGGHPRAAGFTMPTKNLPRLQEHLSRLATTQLEKIDLRPGMDIDAEVTLPELGGDTFRTIQQLAPFGEGNTAPAFLSRRVEVMDCRTMGGNGEHLRMKLKQGGTIWNGVGFRLGNNETRTPSTLDIVYNLEIDRWGGEERLRLNILDFATSNEII